MPAIQMKTGAQYRTRRERRKQLMMYASVFLP